MQNRYVLSLDQGIVQTWEALNPDFARKPIPATAIVRNMLCACECLPFFSCWHLVAEAWMSGLNRTSWCLQYLSSQSSWSTRSTSTRTAHSSRISPASPFATIACLYACLVSLPHLYFKQTPPYFGFLSCPLPWIYQSNHYLHEVNSCLR